MPWQVLSDCFKHNVIRHVNYTYHNGAGFYGYGCTQNYLSDNHHVMDPEVNGFIPIKVTAIIDLCTPRASKHNYCSRTDS